MTSNEHSYLSLEGFYKKIDQLEFKDPSKNYEQYKTTPHILRQLQDKIHKVVIDKGVIDLGCGTGIIALFCSLIGASRVIGIDIDSKNLTKGYSFAVRYNITNINWLAAPIEFFNFHRITKSKLFTTVFTNPPFGAWRRGIDIRFVQIGMKIADHVISFHKQHKKTRSLMDRIASQHKFRSNIILTDQLHIAKTMNFHKVEYYPVDVDVYVFSRI